jgi:hypothetical protein
MHHKKENPPATYMQRERKQQCGHYIAFSIVSHISGGLQSVPDRLDVGNSSHYNDFPDFIFWS